MHQVDYTNTFCQAPLEKKNIEFPKVFELPNKVLLLRQIVYSIRQSLLNCTTIFAKMWKIRDLSNQIMMYVCSQTGIL